MSFRSHSRGSSQFAEKVTEDPVTYKTAQSTVTCIYQAHISGFWRNVTVLWSKNLMNHSLMVMVTNVEGDMNYCCKVDLKPWHFWNKKGYKSFDVEGNPVEVYWDFRSAKFTSSPEPSSDFYVALVSEEEVVLLVGDYKKKAFKRTKSRPALVEAALFYKKENVFGKKCFTTRAKFYDRKKEHEIIVESSTSGPKEPEMWISIDGIVLIQVKNLQWKFRGNQTVLVDKQPVQVFWDVYDWLFSMPGTGHGLFIFKPGTTEDSDMEGSGHGGGGGGESDTSTGSRYYSTKSSNPWPPEFCLFLHAYKLE
ncbi:hypothetical protein AtNW77_Chr2g0224641 [Arabidopsis thaliana]|uniref:DUF868 family protein (DUF868) n=5 Tax=Arabidopsis TaxID=3701 RepID=Q9SI11_ARATH|nr:DUF868 family protein (DUF868) [Arabidopsis thaliana]KAG7635828.1 hypothetical protein ISN45_At02g003180 [Arabidopsis thaliana x Arabidopsis arenosa]KAG7640480.1 hypothetical protein ISN44_As02g003240 [Arabidopsis suecica]AAD27916.2 hypothetical protein [Arabidopsis thaliana]AAM15482.1 hypothetical protein [Arabidopsis thaliana]ABE65426.1 hypothetical protein At2g04220 [Arabidopsis thaliana]|eukprot:NP_178505.1 DUF868 family protein (DUF868) [Arabidopsis thaliana]